MATSPCHTDAPDYVSTPLKGRAQVRPFVSGDLTQVTALHETVFPNESGLCTAELQSYFAEVFLNNPWVDEALPSLVYEHAGKIVGFVGVLPRALWAGKRKIRAAVLSQLMVHPGHRSPFAAIALLKTAMSGPQELSFTDGANEDGRKLFENAGAVAPLIYNLHWLRILRPGAFSLSRIGKYLNLSTVSQVAASFIRPVDSVMARAYGHPLTIRRTESDDPLQPDELVEHVRTFSSRHTLRPEYDATSLQWLLALAAKKDPPATLRVRQVRGPDGRIAGWYVYFLKPGGVSHVLQLGGGQQRIGTVLDHLLNDAFTQGTLAVSGRMEPDFTRELWNHGAFFIWHGAHFVCHSADREVLNAVCAGDAFISRLEGEWWMRFRDYAPTRHPWY